ncbi:aminoglycoside phosphotransferase family protein [Desulfovibrio ferrophilus]|uniref:Aminoglycoside phosphotransferase n=1 Tax=Desulfovibrio ferrophilus TaxID=241368 RepID=A0A2Z6AW39_9BACT|nr:aminoglycoside phosphotransferase family protein [Desulfovibrio ferrophilus]BBD07405.1 aminoglycoside phosphotransferase [Desulfovibrio ferrophilus]
MRHDQIPENIAVETSEEFGLSRILVRHDIAIPGSPERCVARVVVADDSAGLWVLERLFPKQADRRESVARAMAKLQAGGLGTVPAYRPSRQGSHVLRKGGWDWQIGPYVPGDRLPQPEYIQHDERGRSLASFITGLQRLGPEASAGLDAVFSLPEYMDDLLVTISKNRPELLTVVQPVREALSELDEAWDELPRSLAHGDFHPLNVIWKGQLVRSVIDWEFCGLRPELYDAANMLGCTGSEDPKFLASGLARAFLVELRQSGVLTTANGRWLFPLFLGLRFAWLSEWLRRSDDQMIEMEMAYMRLLLNNRSDLERIWLS